MGGCPLGPIGLRNLAHKMRSHSRTSAVSHRRIVFGSQSGFGHFPVQSGEVGNDEIQRRTGGNTEIFFFLSLFVQDTVPVINLR